MNGNFLECWSEIKAGLANFFKLFLLICLGFLFVGGLIYGYYLSIR